MTINFLQAGGYFLFSGVGNIGDWAVVIQGFQPAWLWRVGLTMLGVGSYLIFVWIALLEMRPFLGQAEPERLQRVKKLTLVPYFTGGVFFFVAGAVSIHSGLLVSRSHK